MLKRTIPLKKLLDEDASPTNTHRGIRKKLSIISFLFHSRDSSRNSLKGYIYPPSLFYSTIKGHQGWKGQPCKGLASSSPNSLYFDLLGDMHKKYREKEDSSNTTI